MIDFVENGYDVMATLELVQRFTELNRCCRCHRQQMSVAHKLLCRVNGSSTTSDTAKAMPAKNPEDELKAFISEDPDSRYTFDSERGASDSQICREGKDKGRKCITLHMHTTKMFEAMQAQGFFCALPMDPSRTYMECRRIPKT